MYRNKIFIKIITKLLNVIGYHQPNLSTIRTVLCVHAVVVHFVLLTVVFLIKMYHRSLASFPNFITVLIDW